MNSGDIRKKFLDFFEKRVHSVVPSASLVPEGDPSVLFTTAGMQQFKPYYLGKKDAMVDFGTLNTVSIQKCVRTSDIDEVGDESHLTFFEMLGNFSFGGYFKEEAIKYGYEFITQEMKLSVDYVSVFGGEGDLPADTESERIWKSIEPNIKIKRAGRADNFWGPTGDEGPCGPTTEIYVRGLEIWNIVFNEHYQSKDKTLTKLPTPGVDTGMGLERLVMVLQKKENIFETDLFSPLDVNNLPSIMSETVRRIMLDHGRAITFLVSDGVKPSNVDRGYILRRLMRRMMAHFHKSARGPFKASDVTDLDFVDIENLLERVVDNYRHFYPELDKEKVLKIFREENSKFKTAINRGLRELKKLNTLDAKAAFKLFESYGLTFEIIKDFGGEKAVSLSRDDFDAEFKKHQEISRAGAEQKFKGGLAGHSETEIKYHTTTHLLHQALHDIFGSHVVQKGSNITPERLRFDFSHPQKMTDEEKRKVEEIVNQKIRESLPVQSVVLPRDEAEKTGAHHFFGEKYGDKVSIYFIGRDLASAYSKEFCGGPHVKNTSELGVFKIIKEEAVAAGVRRIKATLSGVQ
ncbi:alanine--tRNA ligase [Patescibacteria group bacterium]|nr:MAG: alanine--tRNA ligase [Patescibacteria group bacterium]